MMSSQNVRNTVHASQSHSTRTGPQMMSGQNVRNTVHASQSHSTRTGPLMMSGQNVRNTVHASQYKDRSSHDVRSECKKHHACLTEQGQVPK
jgi:hypothetical protein